MECLADRVAGQRSGDLVRCQTFDVAILSDAKGFIQEICGREQAPITKADNKIGRRLPGESAVGRDEAEDRLLRVR